MTVDHLTDAPHNSTTSRFADSRANAKALTRGLEDTTWHSHVTPHGSRRDKARDSVRQARPPHSVPICRARRRAMWAHSHATYTPMPLDLCRHASTPAHSARGEVVDSL